MTTATETTCINRDTAIKAIRSALKRRSGKAWSVTGGSGSAYGWIRIDAAPKSRTWHHVDTGRKDENGHAVCDEINDPSREFGHMGPDDRVELAALLGLEKVHYQGESVAADSTYRREYIDRAEGREVTVVGQRYWD